MRGNYLLILRLDKEVEIEVGKLGKIRFKPGYYVYIGSAMGGFFKRINRYFTKISKKHWHVDYLLEHAEVLAVVLIPSEVNLEERISEIMEGEPIPGFGCTDRKSISHLFRVRELDLIRLLKRLKQFKREGLGV